MNRILDTIRLYLDMKKVYVILFSTLAFWAFFAYFTLNGLISNQEKYSKLINISGKQRMLSQKTALISRRYFITNQIHLKKHLDELIRLMKEDHNYLIFNYSSNKIREIYLGKEYKLDSEVKNYFSFLDNFFANPTLENLEKIETSSFNLLPKLDYAVSAFEKESTDKIKNAKDKETIILMLTLITLFFEALVIVFPSLNLVRKKQIELKKVNIELKRMINEEKRVLREKDKLLLEQSKMASMGELLHNISNQWRQPLSVIQTAASGTKLQKEYNNLNDDMLIKNLDVILNSTSLLSNTIDGFREFLKKDRELILVNLKKINEKSLKLIGDRIAEIKFLEEIEDIDIIGFPNEILQVFINIYTNAIEILSNKKGKKLVFTKIKNLDNSVLIEIIDNGGGFEKEITIEKPQETGVGLYIVNEIITKKLCGSVEIINDNFSHNGEEYYGAKYKIILKKS